MRLQIGFLQHVLGFGIVLQDRAGRAEEHTVVAAHQLLEGVQIAGDDGARELGVLEARGDGPRFG